VGAALAVFGAGSFVGAVSSGVGAIIDSLSGMFGESMLDRLKKFGDARISMLGRIKKFGDAKIDTAGIKTNAAALTAFGTAFHTLARSNVNDLEFDLDTSSILKLNALSDVNGMQLQETAKGIQSFANISGFEAKLEGLKDLKARDIDEYRKSLDKLVETLEDMNRELSGGRGGGRAATRTRASAGDLLNQTSASKSQDGVNSSALLSVLEEIRDLNKRTLRAIGGLSGNVHD